MTEEGVSHITHRDILTFEELTRLVAIFSKMGISKVRLTGGEPFVRLGCMTFIERLKHDLGVEHLHITTNGVETYKHLEKLKGIGVSGLNVSLDTLDRDRFIELTRRDHLDKVLRTIDGALGLGISLKLNCVVTGLTLDDEIRALSRFASNEPVSVRFIEQMPFSGNQSASMDQAEKLLDRMHRLFPDLRELKSDQAVTARLFSRDGFLGTIGIIEGNSRKFCGRCNKVRVTPEGKLKTCLYDDGVLDLKGMIRNTMDDGSIEEAIRQRLGSRQLDGDAAEGMNRRDERPSMAAIGG
jgi:cyclic pyranopterin phosphate synthase